MATTTKSRRGPKKAAGMTPNQQWLALALLAILGVLAVFFFKVGTGSGNGTGHSGLLVPWPLIVAGVTRLRSEFAQRAANQSR